MNDIDLTAPEFYFNREMSLLDFNWRVLEQAKNEATPLLERLNFLCISSTNMDEFFEVRVAVLVQKLELGSAPRPQDGMSNQELMKLISGRAHELVDEQYRVLNEILLPLMEEEDIRIIRRGHWSEKQKIWLREYFEEELLPMLSPLGLDSAHPFPRILNKSLNFIVSLTGKDAFGRKSGLALVRAPRSLPRVIQLPEDIAGSHDLVFLTSVIHEFVGDLFYGMKLKGCFQFRVTRNSDLFVDSDEVGDLMHAVEGELAQRNYGDEVRLEVAHNCPDEMCDFLLQRFGMSRESLYQVRGLVNLNRIRAVYDLVDKPELKFQPYSSSTSPAFKLGKDIFEVIRKQDVLLHHPFDSFTPVIDFIRQAASDPQVLAVKQTLYRTGPGSPIVDALAAAARNGKEVTVVIELRARFDERANIKLATKLQEASVHVVYGVVGYKTHAKMSMVVRREGKKLSHYVHLGTGNYHRSTARLYTDYGLFTCDKAIGEDVRWVFFQLTSLGKLPKLDKLLQSPFTLHSGIIEKIQNEITLAESGKPAKIIFKVNSLVEPLVIQALYRASCAGVDISLIVRGMCCLKPGLPDISDNIRVISIIGRFLEHTRVFYFENAGHSEVYCASADLMERNLFKRVEVAFPIEHKKHKERIIEELNLYLADNCQSWTLQADGGYVLSHPEKDEPSRSVQTILLEGLKPN
ncbi:MAG: polyphosphate kinase 1 [Methylococcales bacterium]|jgi:polyphosphate kinase|nr:polyphosphate kinase 1 [Methylococcales bacterium]MBT7443181.1 polyphosphate kinase 1 [Methylococcales bacterium]